MAYLLALMLLLTPPAQDPTGGPLVLRFNWPGEVAARVDTEYVQEYSDGQHTTRAAWLVMSQRMRVHLHDEGRRIQYSGHEYVTSGGDIISALGALYSAWVPTTIVDHQGTFVRIEDASHAQQLVSDLFTRRMDDPTVQALPVFREFLRRLSSGETLVPAVKSEWTDLVGRWLAVPLGSDLLELAGQQAIAPGVTVPTRMTLGLLDRVSCPRGQEPRACGVLEFTSHIERAGLERLVAFAMEGATLPADDRQVHEMGTTVRVTLEIDTMLPHHFEITRRLHQTGTMGDVPVSLTAVERRTSRYTYLADH